MVSDDRLLFEKGEPPANFPSREKTHLTGTPLLYIQITLMKL